MSRTTLTEMAERGEIKTCVIRKRGATRGIRLLHLPSLQAALERMANEESVSRHNQSFTSDKK